MPPPVLPPPVSPPPVVPPLLLPGFGVGTTTASSLPIFTLAVVPAFVYTTCIPSALVYTKYKTCPLALQVIHCTVPLTPASAAIVVVAVLPSGGSFTCSRYCPLPSVKATLPPVTSGAFASNGPAQFVRASAPSLFFVIDAFCTKAYFCAPCRVAVITHACVSLTDCFSLALSMYPVSAGTAKAASTPRITNTTISSTSVKPPRLRGVRFRPVIGMPPLYSAGSKMLWSRLACAPMLLYSSIRYPLAHSSSAGSAPYSAVLPSTFM